MESSDRADSGTARAESHNSRSWPKRGRPQSYVLLFSFFDEPNIFRMIAQEWSDKLDNLFKIDSGLDTRLQSVEEK